MSECAKPLLFLDVDGVLDRFAERSGTVDIPGRVKTPCITANGWRTVFLSEAADPNRMRLLAGSFDLVWATTMEEHANTMVSPIMGLGELPFVTEGVTHEGSKVPSILDYADDRPFAWVDDDVLPWEVSDVTSGNAAPVLVISPDPQVGLTGAIVTQLLAWADALTR